MNTQIKQLISSKEIADFLGISKSTLACWRTNKLYKLPYIKVGGRVRYDLQEINLWLNSRTKNQFKLQGGQND